MSKQIDSITCMIGIFSHVIAEHSTQFDTNNLDDSNGQRYELDFEQQQHFLFIDIREATLRLQKKMCGKFSWNKKTTFFLVSAKHTEFHIFISIFQFFFFLL